jgi:hypothetical protein
MNWAIRGVGTSLLGYSLLTAFLFSPALEAAAQTAGTFIPAGYMTAARGGHTAVLLPNGKVLIIGGRFDGMTGAELFDPVTGIFSATGEMITGRHIASATLLADGRVLIAGGANTSAELYDPATGTFTATGSMLKARGWTTATLLYDGRVLVAGGVAGGESAPELYDPATGTFSLAGPFAGTYVAPEVETATLLPDGTVLIAGCDCNLPPPFYSGPLYELYDPATGTFSLSGAPTGPITWWDNINTWTLLRNGKVLIAGNYENDGFPAQALLFEPSTRIFSGIGNTTAPHEFSTATLLPDGEVLIAGGALPRSNGSVGTDLYDPSTGTFSAGGNMTTGRQRHTATLLPDGTILIAGGFSYWPGATSSAELYVPRLLTPPLAVTDLRFDLAVIPPGASYFANISGSGLTVDTFFDVRFTSPGSSRSAVVLNWQRGVVESHGVPTGLSAGKWTINGVRAHQIETDHTGNFFQVSATITVSP